MGSKMGMNHSCYSHDSDRHRRDNLLPRWLYDGHIQVLCISPCVGCSYFCGLMFAITRRIWIISCSQGVLASDASVTPLYR